MTDLLSLLQAEFEALEAFSRLLTEENTHLEVRDADSLPGVAKRKSAVIAQLGALGDQRNLWLLAHGYAEDQAGVESWLADKTTPKNAKTLWQSLLQTARQSRDLNQLNSQLLNQQLQTTSEALAILTREASRQSLYGSDGQPQALTGNRVIDSA